MQQVSISIVLQKSSEIQYKGMYRRTQVEHVGKTQKDTCIQLSLTAHSLYNSVNTHNTYCLAGVE